MRSEQRLEALRPLSVGAAFGAAGLVALFSAIAILCSVRALDAAGDQPHHAALAIRDVSLAILGGVVLSIGVFIVQLRVQAHVDDRYEDEARKRAVFHVLMTGHDLTGIDLEFQRLQNLYLSGRTFASARLSSAIFDGAVLRDCRFERAEMVGASMKAVDLAGSSFQGSDVTGVDFTGAEGLDRKAFRDAIWDSTTLWPEGFDLP